MHAWEAIQKTVDYIEANMASELGIEELAKLAALSPFYYQRLFSRLVKRPVMEYIKLRRLARAYEIMANWDVRIVDIALDCGFSSHQTFTKAFKEAFGITPEQFRKNPVLLVQFTKPDLLLHYVMVDEGVPLISDGLVLEFNRRILSEPILFMGVTGFIPINGPVLSGNDTGVDTLGEVWRRFHQEKHLIPLKPHGRTLDVGFQGDAPEGHFTFFAGAEVEPGAHDKDFVNWQLPAREYIVCGFEAEDFDKMVTDAVYKAWQYSKQWLDRHGLMKDERACSPEVYYSASPEGNYMELWLAAAEERK